jgi:hypothetical protein
MSEWIPVGLFVQLLISILSYVSGRRHHSTSIDGVEVFRINPMIAWLVIIVCYSFAAFLGYLILTSSPTPWDAPVAFIVAEPAIFGFGLIGIYYLTMRVRVGAHALSVSGIFGNRTTQLSDVAAVIDRQTGRFRTLRAIDWNGKKILNVTSSFLGDYDELVGLLQAAAQRIDQKTSGQR